MDDKFKFGIVVITIVAGLQITAWYLGQNGTIYAFTSLIVGLITGKLLDFTFNKAILKDEKSTKK